MQQRATMNIGWETVREEAWDYRYKEIRTMRIRVSDLLAETNPYPHHP